MNARPRSTLGVEIYALTPQWTDQDKLLSATDQALQNGISLLQYRDKLRDFNAKAALGKRLARLCRRHSVPLIVNDDIDLALEVGADGIHIGRDDAPIERAIGAGFARVGVSCYNQVQRAIDASHAGVTEVAFGSFYASQTKPDAATASDSLLGDFLRWRAPESQPRLVAIGGINADNAKPLATAGAEYLAVCGAIYAATDVAAATRALIESVNPRH